MSTSFSQKFLSLVENLVDTLDPKGRPGNKSNRVFKSALSADVILPGDVLFFTYTSKKFGTGSHVVMVVGNKRGYYGVFQHNGKRYLSAVKLNNIWAFTASLIIEAYRDKFVKYTPETKEEEEKKETKQSSAPSEKTDTDRMKKAFMTLVGRTNYRTYIMNQMDNYYEVGDPKD
tara:strand:+ start:430 stop:951 length:522 start_codon:yes stop_codon:yes gene_type:complete